MKNMISRPKFLREKIDENSKKWTQLIHYFILILRILHSLRTLHPL
jgi:hypothetical protein